MDRKRLYYTFGNHMHWVDMEWLWGYHVLRGSTRDMLTFSRQTGARGNVNFDGIGYERLAVENPDAFQELRNAVREGQIEIVGGSYGQPYGGLHGGESNVRQRVYGVRTALRLFGVRPRTFWEEEFDFFPQLPQMLKGVGFDGASLFFQWTWHTPDVPVEDSPIVQWEGHDGTRIPAASRNRLNLHQWPEDIDALLNSLGNEAVKEGPTPLILQWLELMPSPDWMCRSEVLLPKTKELLADPRFEFCFCTLGEYLRSEDTERAPVRRYGPDDVFHGISLGKNGDLFRRLSGRAERSLLTAETWAAIAGFFGRPYAQWDVYPTWELEESWRELLQAQHHDNDECEGLCGHVGRFSYDRSLNLSTHVRKRTLELLERRIDVPSGSRIFFNPLGWAVDFDMVDVRTQELMVFRDIPAMGWRAYEGGEEERFVTIWTQNSEGAVGRCGEFEVEVNSQGQLVQIRTSDFPDGILDPSRPLLLLTCEGEPLEYESIKVRSIGPRLSIQLHQSPKAKLEIALSLAPGQGAIDIWLSAHGLSRPMGGMNAGIQTSFGIAAPLARLSSDSPYAIHEVRAEGTYKRKYPTGDWMTSDQWFEDIVNPFHSLSLVDLAVEAGAGLLILHDGSQQWFREGDRVRNLLTMYDPWDEDYWVNDLTVRYRLIPHRGLTPCQKWRKAQEFLRGPSLRVKRLGSGDLPSSFSAVSCPSDDAVITALYRETLEAGAGLGDYAGRSLNTEHPYVLRLVEFNGQSSEADLKFAGTVSRGIETNLLGETVRPFKAPLRLMPHSINTLMLDIVEGRKVTRDLDARRGAWATVHRLE